jgi:hypothetical protein
MACERQRLRAARDRSPMQLESTLTCPSCGHWSVETMPTDACQFLCRGPWYAGIGHGCRSPAHDGNLICKIPPRRGSDNYALESRRRSDWLKLFTRELGHLAIQSVTGNPTLINAATATPPCRLWIKTRPQPSFRPSPFIANNRHRNWPWWDACVNDQHQWGRAARCDGM